MSGDGSVKTLIEPRCESINQLSEDGALYLIKENGKYGITKISGEGNDISATTFLKSEYQSIGIGDQEIYKGMESKYIINGKYIPVEMNDKWGLVSIEGDVLILPQYDAIGCNTNEIGEPVIVLPDLNPGMDAVVFGVKKVNPEDATEKMVYVLVNPKKNDKIGLESSSIYSIYENDKEQYWMEAILANNEIMGLDIYDVYGSKNSKEQ